MLNDLNPKDFKNIYIVCGFTDMRLGINGLSSIIEHRYKMNIFIPKTLFLFCGFLKILLILQKISLFSFHRINSEEPYSLIISHHCSIILCMPILLLRSRLFAL